MRPPRSIEPIFPPNPGSSIEVCYASPVSMGPHLEGDDGRIRTSHSSSRDDINAPLDCFIEEDFRAGGPCLSPLPIGFPALSDTHPAYDRIMDAFYTTRFQVRDILRTRGVDYHSIGYHLNYHESSDFTYSIPTINVAATRHSLDEPWLETAREIYAFVASRRFPDIAVDIYDSDACQIRRHSLLLEDFETTPWTEATAAITDFLAGLEVVDCDFARIGPGATAEENTPTVVLIVCEQSGRDWRLLREKVVAVFDVYGLSHVAVSIVKRCPREGASVCAFCGKKPLVW